MTLLADFTEEAARERTANREFVAAGQPKVIRKDIYFGGPKSNHQERSEIMTAKPATAKVETKKDDGNRPALFGGLAMKRGQELAGIRLKGYELWQGGTKEPIALRTTLNSMFGVKLPKPTVYTWCGRWAAGKVPDGYKGDGGKVHEKVHEQAHETAAPLIPAGCIVLSLREYRRLKMPWILRCLVALKVRLGRWLIGES